MIIVTGAAGIVGSAVVRALASAGHDIAAVDIAETFPDYGTDGGPNDGTDSARILTRGGVDLTDAEAVTSAFAALGNEAEINGLANIAGGFVWERLDANSPAEAAKSWERMFRLNLFSAVNASAAVLPCLRENGGGAIVNIAAAATLKAGAGMGAYSASKSGVMRLTESLAAEEMPHGVRVNAVLPSIIDTPQNRADMGEENAADWVSPEALADVAAFLLSEGARAITGAALPVTGKVGW